MYDLGTNHFTFVKSKHQPNHPACSTFLGLSICRRIGNSGERDTWSFLALLELNTDHKLSEVSKTLLERSISTLSWHGSCRLQCSCVALCQYCSGLAVPCIKGGEDAVWKAQPSLTWDLAVWRHHVNSSAVKGVSRANGSAAGLLCSVILSFFVLL